MPDTLPCNEKVFVFAISVGLTVGIVAFVDVSSVHNQGGHGDIICVGVFVISVADIGHPGSYLTRTPVTALPNILPTPSTAHFLDMY